MRLSNTEQLAHQYLSPKILENQEHLSLEILSQLRPSSITDYGIDNSNDPRPQSSFIELMNWTERHFSEALEDQENLNKFVQNRIIVDGQFVEYCENNKIVIETLHRDSIISWKTDHDFEKYFVQGVFLIKTANLEFLHAALFHKGNQNEDEVSFFIIVSDKNYEAYVKLRNHFDTWVQERDRSNS